MLHPLATLLACLPPLLGQGDPARDLGSKEFETRLAAVRLLATSDRPDRRKLLLGALKDDDWEIVEEAARALGRGGGGDPSDALDVLVRLALTGPVRRVRRVAAESAGALGPAAAWEGVAKKVAGKLAGRACEAMWSLAPGIDGRVSLKPIEKALKSREASVRAAAAHALVLVAGEERPARLAGLLERDEIRVQAAALEATGRAGDPACLEGVLAVLRRNDLNDVLERRAVEAVRSILAAVEGDDRAGLVDSMLAATAQAQDDATRARLARAWGRVADGEGAPVEGVRAVEGLASALGASSPGTRSAAAGALGRIGTEDALGRAAALAVDDGDGHVRLVALLAVLRRRGAEDPSTLELLADRIESDPEPLVREQAAVALGVKGLAGAVEPLVGALRDSDWAVAVCAAVSLGKTRQARAIGPLVEAHGAGEDWRLRGAAVVGLGHLLRKEAIPPVIEALDDPDGTVRRSAHEILLSIAKRNIEPEVEAWRAWWAAAEKGIVLLDPEEEADRRERYGYGRTPAEVYEGLDVIVFESRGDHIQNVLSDLGIEHRLTRQGRIAEDEPHHRAVFVSNCTGEMTAEDVERLAWFLRAGGYLFGSCWAVQETVARAYPGVVDRLPTRGEVLDDVLASATSADSPYLEGVFPPDVTPMYALEGAYLIEVLDPERCEVLVDSPECADRWGGGNLAVWFRTGHGIVLDSVNHFEEQGLERATWLKKPQERMAFAVDHMGLGYAELRETRGAKFWKNGRKAAAEIKDLSVFHLITNFVRHKRIAGDG